MKQASGALVILVGLVLITGCQEREEKPAAIKLAASLDTTVATIGDILHFKVTVLNPGRRPLRFPPLKSTDTLEVRQATPFQSPRGDSNGLRFELVFWDTGHFVIPAYEVAVLKADSTLDYTLHSAPLPVQVVSVLEQYGARQLQPVKPPVPVTIPWPWPTIGKYLLLLMLVVGIGLIWRQRQKTEIIKTAAQPVKPPPDEVARQKLQALREDSSLKRGAVKEFYVDLSYLLREYVEHSVFIKTLEMTTEQIHAMKNTLPFDRELVDQWLEVLRRADFTKYARGSVSPAMCQQDLDWAECFIAQTVPFWKTWEAPSKAETVPMEKTPVETG